MAAPNISIDSLKLVFFHLDRETLCETVCLVCKPWASVLKRPVFWWQFCLHKDPTLLQEAAQTKGFFDSKHWFMVAAPRRVKAVRTIDAAVQKLAFLMALSDRTQENFTLPGSCLYNTLLNVLNGGQQPASIFERALTAHNASRGPKQKITDETFECFLRSFAVGPVTSYRKHASDWRTSIEPWVNMLRDACAELGGKPPLFHVLATQEERHAPRRFGKSRAVLEMVVLTDLDSIAHPSKTKSTVYCPHSAFVDIRACNNLNGGSHLEHRYSGR